MVHKPHMYTERWGEGDALQGKAVSSCHRSCASQNINISPVKCNPYNFVKDILLCMSCHKYHKTQYVAHVMWGVSVENNVNFWGTTL